MINRPDLAARVAELQAKMTPGPLNIRKHSVRMEITGNIHQVCDLQGYPVAFVPAWDDPGPGGVDGTDEAKANAAAIALLPDLMRDYLAALAELDEAREFSDTQMAGHGETMRELKAAEAELARIRSAIDVQPVTVADHARALLAAYESTLSTDIDQPQPYGTRLRMVVLRAEQTMKPWESGFHAGLRALAKGDDHE